MISLIDFVLALLLELLLTMLPDVGHKTLDRSVEGELARLVEEDSEFGLLPHFGKGLHVLLQVMAEVLGDEVDDVVPPASLQNEPPPSSPSAPLRLVRRQLALEVLLEEEVQAGEDSVDHGAINSLSGRSPVEEDEVCEQVVHHVVVDAVVDEGLPLHHRLHLGQLGLHLL